jgi:hypothetical protein
MGLIWIVIGVVLVIVWVVTVVDIVRRHLDSKHTAAWLLVVILLPFVGAVAYWAMRKPTAAEIERQAHAGSALRHERAERSVDSTRF